MLNYALTEVPVFGEECSCHADDGVLTERRMTEKKMTSLTSTFTASQLVIASCSAIYAEKTIQTFAESFKMI